MLRTTAAATHLNPHAIAEEENHADPVVALAGVSQVSHTTVDSKIASATANVADATSPGISGGLPQLFFMQYKVVPLNWETFKIIFPFAIVLCGVGLIESLMTLTLIDEITETRGHGNRECVGQGAANLVCGLFGGMGGCAMICLLYTSPSPRDATLSRMPSSA